jgi:hypothetical protein
VTIKTVSFSASALCWLRIRLAHFGAAGATNRRGIMALGAIRDPLARQGLS